MCLLSLLLVVYDPNLPKNSKNFTQNDWYMTVICMSTGHRVQLQLHRVYVVLEAKEPEACCKTAYLCIHLL